MSLTGPSDTELVSRFKGGDRGAYAEIVRRYQHKVYTLCVRWLGDDAVAEEVAQDVFIALFRSLADFRGDSQLSTWIYRVAINHCKNRRIYRMRRKVDQHDSIHGSADDDDRPRDLVDANAPGTDAGVFRDEAAVLVQQALGDLDDEQRQIVVLRDVEDLSYEEIADLLEVPRGTVKSRLHRARAQLAKLLQRRVRLEDLL